jgi:hypothetical protein
MLYISADLIQAIEWIKQGFIPNPTIVTTRPIDKPIIFEIDMDEQDRHLFEVDECRLDLVFTVYCNSDYIPSFITELKTNCRYSNLTCIQWNEQLRLVLVHILETEFVKELPMKCIVGKCTDE